MLSKNELENVMRLKQLTLIQAEKDYLQNLLLYIIYSIVGKELVFKGGTCLYKLHGLNRFSEDLDFSISKPFNFEERLKKILYIASQYGVYCRVKTMKKYHNQLNIGLDLKGPLYNGNPNSLCFIGFDISLRKKPLLPAERKTLISTYQDIPSADVFAMDLKEILLEKIVAIYTRKKSRDLYDAWFLLKFKNVEIDFALLRKKLKRIVFQKKAFIHKIQEEKPVWKTDLAPLVQGQLPSFDQVKKDIEEKMQLLKIENEETTQL